jgi:signal transduction histidine kinase/CheY-like chemotaxis protein
MATRGINPDLLQRFRARSLERLRQVDAAWHSLLQGDRSAETRHGLRHQLHTLKGDASVLGFVELAKLCGALENIFELGEASDYRLPESLDVLLEMVMQFVAMLLRSRELASLPGMDLEGFLLQVGESIEEARTRRVSTLPPESSSDVALKLSDRAPEAVRRRLSQAATTAFIESLNAAGESQGRLRALWRLLQEEAAPLALAPLEGEIVAHAERVQTLAERLGKRVTVEVEVDDVEVPAVVLEVVNGALVHLLTNAVDHGIEAPEARAAAGKPREGHIGVVAVAKRGVVELAVSDDGCGVDELALAAEAERRGLPAPTSSADLLELLCLDGFTTRADVSDTSGRGVGLGAVRELVRGLGGEVALEVVRGEGTRVALRLPLAGQVTEVWRFNAGGTVDLAFESSWEVASEPVGPEVLALDPLTALNLSRDRLRAEQPSLFVLRLRRGAARVSLGATTEPRRCRAVRVCPTSDTDLVEVVRVDDREVLLVRPDVLAAANQRIAIGSNPLVPGRTDDSVLVCATVEFPMGGERGWREVSTAILTRDGRAFVPTAQRLEMGERGSITVSFPGLLEPVVCNAEVIARFARSRPGEQAGMLLRFQPRHESPSLRRVLRGVPAASGEGSALRYPILVAVACELTRLGFGVARDRLARAGGTAIDVVLVADAARVAERLAGGAFALCIVDAALDGDRGHETIALARDAGVPAIAIGRPVGDVPTRMLDAGAVAFLPVPIAIHELYQGIDRLIACREPFAGVA